MKLLHLLVVLRAKLDLLRAHQQIVTVFVCCCIGKNDAMSMVAVADVGRNDSQKTTMTSTSLLESAHLFGKEMAKGVDTRVSCPGCEKSLKYGVRLRFLLRENLYWHRGPVSRQSWVVKMTSIVISSCATNRIKRLLWLTVRQSRSCERKLELSFTSQHNLQTLTYTNSHISCCWPALNRNRNHTLLAPEPLETLVAVLKQNKMAAQRLHGSCSCGRFRHIVDLPPQSAGRAELRYDNSSASRTSRPRVRVSFPFPQKLTMLQAHTLPAHSPSGFAYRCHGTLRRRLLSTLTRRTRAFSAALHHTTHRPAPTSSAATAALYCRHGTSAHVRKPSTSACPLVVSWTKTKSC
jgi:hypothetical protein